MTKAWQFLTLLSGESLWHVESPFKNSVIMNYRLINTYLLVQVNCGKIMHTR